MEQLKRDPNILPVDSIQDRLIECAACLEYYRRSGTDKNEQKLDSNSARNLRIIEGMVKSSYTMLEKFREIL